MRASVQAKKEASRGPCKQGRLAFRCRMLTFMEIRPLVIIERISRKLPSSLTTHTSSERTTHVTRRRSRKTPTLKRGNICSSSPPPTQPLRYIFFCQKARCSVFRMHDMQDAWQRQTCASLASLMQARNIEKPAAAWQHRHMIWFDGLPGGRRRDGEETGARCNGGIAAAAVDAQKPRCVRHGQKKEGWRDQVAGDDDDGGASPV